MGTMTRYADPFVCPDCHTPIPPGADTCRSCALPLTHPLAGELLSTLTHADDLLLQLRAAATRPGAVSTGASMIPAVAPMPAAAPSPRRTGVRTASVPQILLGLGATCLLVAAVIFLAVAWSWLGIEGRTTVLVALTAVSGGTGAWLAGRGLRVAGEALTVVALGLLALDVVGADDAGWLGDLSLAGLVAVAGAVLGTVSLGLALTPTRLVTPQLAAALGLGLAWAGTDSAVTGQDLLIPTLAVLAFAALALLGRTTRRAVLPWAALVGAGFAWLDLLVSSLDGLEVGGTLTFAGVWGGTGGGVLVAAVLLLVPLAVDRRHELTQTCLTAAAVLTTGVLVVPALDEPLTTAIAVALGVLVAGTAAAAVLPRAWSAVALVPAVLAALPVSIVAAALVVDAGVRVLLVDGQDLRLAEEDALVHPSLLVPATVALLLLLAVTLPGLQRLLSHTVAPLALVVTAVATLALFGVPLWTVVVATAVVGVALVADGLRNDPVAGTVRAILAVVVLLAVVVAALPSPVLLTGTLALLTLAAAAILLRGRFPQADLLGGATLPVALAATMWSAADLADIDAVLRAVPVLVVVGLLAIVRPRAEVEAAAAVAGATAAVLAVAAAVDGPTVLAIHLTVAGALVTATSLVHTSRRQLGWAGGLLLAAATWVRLADLGVDAPEAYTLPNAAALVLLGLHRLRTLPEASSATALSPGLVLATVPSLLWVLAGDPISLRAALLGAACLALALLGARLRWSAPLVVGAVVGGLLVLRELVPYAGQTPQWVVIGLAGTVLTVVGVTWERRLVELHQAATYLERLR
ncbi:SCO7613 C-terminal domain-containing membrane protein [Nocardioides psychrotolerans]|nr:hypothetical protein [Nocardioides psychrotolerans]